MRFIFLLVLLPLLVSGQQKTAPTNTAAAAIQIIPQPVSVLAQAGKFVLTANTTIYIPSAPADWATAAEYLTGLIRGSTGYNLVNQRFNDKFVAAKSNSIYFLPDEKISTPEGYVLEIKPTAILIRAQTAAGAFYAVQTLRQLFPAQFNNANTITGVVWSAPCCKIEDAPRFSYRGLHLDVGRHFFPVDFVKRYIDLLAMHKLNTFHWHLTEDQGWRIEIKKYPKLQSVAACRDQTLIGHYSDQPQKFDGKKYCGYYTQEEVKDIVRYAGQRFVTVIPEIELPGHALAALSAYPELGCGPGPYAAATQWGVFEDVFCPNEKTFEFLENVFKEVCALFPGPYVHIGGDECPKTAWENSEFCQQIIRREGLKDEHELQSYFIGRVEKMLEKQGKKIIGWDEILEGGLAPNATVMSWRGIEGGIAAAKAHHDVIMTPGSHLYFDYYQSDPATEPLAIGGLLTMETTYSYEPIPTELSAEESKYILGAQANLWTEYIEDGNKVEYMAYPRVCALAEVVWTQKAKKNWPDFTRRLKAHFARLDAMGVNYAKSYYDINTAYANNKVRLSTLDKTQKIRYTTDGTALTPAAKLYSAPFAITQNTTVRAAVFQGQQQMGKTNTVNYRVHKASGKPYTMSRQPEKYKGGEMYALTNGIVGSSKRWDQWVGLVNHDIDPVIDLGATTTFNRVTTHYCNAKRSWIYPPRSVAVYISNDGKNFVLLAEQYIDADIMIGITAETVQLETPGAKGRYVKMIAKTYGTIPATAATGAGEGVWLFIDEVIVE